MQKIDIRVDDEGYGKLRIGGLLCAVIPFYQLRPDQLERVDEGAGKDPNVPVITEEHIREGLLQAKRMDLLTD